MYAISLCTYVHSTGQEKSFKLIKKKSVNDIFQLFRIAYKPL